MTTLGLFDDVQPPASEALGQEAVLLRAYALASVDALLAGLEDVLAREPFRTVYTPGGLPMSVQLSGCGDCVWVSDRQGYRYEPRHPASGRPWPAMPDAWRALAQDAAMQAGFPGFVPDTCLINRYTPGSRLSLHQDKDERDFSAPIVSVSLGLPARFVFGGLTRNAPAQRWPLFHGDVVVWGGADRLRYHGVLPLHDGHHPLLGRQRINLTFRRAR